MSGSPHATVWPQLADPAAHPEDSSARAGVDWIQTHLSHVFLTGERVYKFRKDVDFGFVRFTSRASRNADCLREIALNRRLSPDVYLGVAPLCEAKGRHWIGPVAESIASGSEAPECCVVMRRLPESRDALSLLKEGALAVEQVDRVAALIADFHRDHSLGRPAPFTPEQWRVRCTGPMEASLQSLGSTQTEAWPESLRTSLHEAARAAAERCGPRFERRRRDGRAVDGHGDLHLQHVWFERDESAPLVIDCLEFDEALRKIDAAAEVAFPAMDLAYRGRPDLGERFLRRYARERDDFDLYGVVDYFICYRAAVRAKVAAIAACDAEIAAGQRAAAAESVERHLELAADSLRSRDVGIVVMVGGVVGAGKSTVANELADRLDGVVISSDRLRKRLAGLAPTDHRPAPPDTGLYTPEWSRRVYAGLLERARPVVSSGRPVILDASFSLRWQRAMTDDWARALNARVRFVEARCGRDVALNRLARRQAEGADPSDAGPSFHAESSARFEPVADVGRLHVVDTDHERWRASLAEILPDLRG